MVNQERITVALEELNAPKRNVRMHPERQIKELMRSLDKFGQCRDLVLDEQNTVLAGNGLWEALKRRGDAEATAIRLIGLTEKQKLQFMLADNKTFGLGVEDLDGVNYVLEQLGADLDVPGYDEETLKSLVATAEQTTEKIMEYGTIDETQISEIRARGERKDATLEKLTREQEQEEISSGEIEEPTGDVQKSVVCPKCGERIWL